MSVDVQQQVHELAKKHFPFDTPNPGQLEAVCWAVTEFLAGKKHVVIGAPTGIGKSAIATTIHRVLEEIKNPGREMPWRTTIITATKGLQDQYVDMDRMIYDLKGKSNYSCPYNKGPYNSGQCRAMVKGGGCNKHTDCPYVIRRRRWCDEAKLRMSNFSFQIEACPAICMEDENRANMIIVDECHDIDDSIVDHTTLTYIPNMYHFTEQIGFPNFLSGMKELITLLQPYSKMEYFDTPADIATKSDQLHDIAESIIESLDYRLEEEKDSLSEKQMTVIGDQLETMQQISDKLGMLNNAHEGAKWIINEYENTDESCIAVIKPIFAWQVAEYALFRKADIFLHMSATICGIDEYASTLGLENYSYGELPNPIPLANRKVYYIPKHKVNAGFRDFEGLGDTINKLANRHRPENGLVHCVSFKLGNDIYQNLPDRTGAFIGRDRNEIVNEMNSHRTSRLCISPSIEKGYDFKGDASRYQIIAKVPYMYLGDPLIKLNSEYREGWYARKAILRIVQACGRSIRGVDDHASTYIIDSSFGRLLSQNRECFPQWFLDSLVEV